MNFGIGYNLFNIFYQKFDLSNQNVHDCDAVKKVKNTIDNCGELSYNLIRGCEITAKEYGSRRVTGVPPGLQNRCE